MANIWQIYLTIKFIGFHFKTQPKKSYSFQFSVPCYMKMFHNFQFHAIQLKLPLLCESPYLLILTLKFIYVAFWTQKTNLNF